MKSSNDQKKEEDDDVDEEYYPSSSLLLNPLGDPAKEDVMEMRNEVMIIPMIRR